MAAVAIRYENVFWGIIPYPTNRSRLKMLAYVVGRPCAYFTTLNLLLRKNGHFKMVLNMSTYFVK